MRLLSDTLTMQWMVQEPAGARVGGSRALRTARRCCEVISDLVAAKAALGKGGHIAPSCCLLPQLVQEHGALSHSLCKSLRGSRGC